MATKLSFAERYHSAVTDHVNQEIEEKLMTTEYQYNVVGSRYGICMISGIWRVGLGGVVAGFASIYALFKLLEAACKLCIVGKKYAITPFLECAYAVTYIAHGVANAIRGIFEFFHIIALMNLDPRVRFIEYPAENGSSIYRGIESEELELASYTPRSDAGPFDDEEWITEERSRVEDSI
jgi:hypothetical protein